MPNQRFKDLQEMLKNAKTREDFEAVSESLTNFIQRFPTHGEALYQLGMMAVRLGDFEKAKVSFQRACLLSPNEPVWQHHLGNVYRQLGEYAFAKEAFEKALTLDPDYAACLNNYGLLCYQQRDYGQAAKLFRQALTAQKDYVDALYNLALALKALGQVEEAIACLLALIEADSAYFRAPLLLGRLLLKQKLFDEADKYFKCAIQASLGNAPLLLSMIKSFLDCDRYQEAKFYCEQFLACEPNNLEVLYNLAVIEAKLNHKSVAIGHYLHILELDAEYFPALNNLAVLYLEKQNLEAAKFYFQKALLKAPHDESIRYTLSAMEGKAGVRQAPSSYIKNLFDHYADHFDEHLNVSLDYRVPMHLIDVLKGALKPGSAAQKNAPNAQQLAALDVVDLGCGTGLCGERLRPLARRLVGVDLSPKMIEKAKEKGCYDELAVQSNEAYLNSQPKGQLDLITAADVFVYQGELTPIFKACFDALKKGGLFSFTTEILPNQDGFMMSKTGRFSHARSYVETVARKTGFEVLYIETKPTRVQGDRMLEGYYFVLRKMTD